jgi:GNAT superfamily N-acetyltransferase
MNLEMMEHSNDELWRLIGRYFASPSIRAELGRPMSSLPGDLWWIAIVDDRSVAGFAALRGKNKKAELRHAYVLPAFRRQGIYTELLKARLAFAHGKYEMLETTATAASLPLLLKCGFVQRGNRGKYAKLVKLL